MKFLKEENVVKNHTKKYDKVTEDIQKYNQLSNSSSTDKSTTSTSSFAENTTLFSFSTDNPTTRSSDVYISGVGIVPLLFIYCFLHTTINLLSPRIKKK